MKNVMEENAYYYALNAKKKKKKAEMKGWDWSLIHSDKELPRWHSGKEPFSNSEVAGDEEGSVSVLEDPLEEEVTTHSRTFAWEIPWTEEPGGLHGFAKRTIRLSIHSYSDNSEVSLRQNLDQNLKKNE